jgi:hypothetical protein
MTSKLKYLFKLNYSKKMKNIHFKLFILLYLLNGKITAQWLTTGNSIISTNYIGTNNAFPLNFKTNLVQHMTLTTTGRLGLGLTAPVSQLHLARNTSSLGSLFRTDGLNTEVNT